VLPQVGQVFNFGLVSMRDVNSKLLFDSEIGALGDALSESEVDRAVIANGDHGEGDDDVNFRREASVGLMDSSGLVEHGRVGRTLLETDSGAPFGTRYDNQEVAKAFGEFWEPDSVVLVEASDMVRYGARSRSCCRPAGASRRPSNADELLGQLLEQVDLDRTGDRGGALRAAGHRPDRGGRALAGDRGRAAVLGRPVGGFVRPSTWPRASSRSSAPSSRRRWRHGDGTRRLLRRRRRPQQVPGRRGRGEVP
jgi:hypothetical protein